MVQLFCFLLYVLRLYTPPTPPDSTVRLLEVASSVEMVPLFIRRARSNFKR